MTNENITVEEPTADRNSLLMTFPYSLVLDMGAYEEVAELTVQAEIASPTEPIEIVSMHDDEDGREVCITELDKGQVAEVITEATAIVNEHLRSLADYNVG